MRIDIAVRNDIARIENSKDVMELRKNLNHMISQIQKAMDEKNENVCNIAHIAQKGIRHCSKAMENKMVFVCGEYFEKIENMIETHKSRIHTESVSEIMSAHTSQTIAKYLLSNGCVVRNMALFDTKIAKNLFDTYLDEMIALGVVRQDACPEYEWIELSAEGYAYCRKHYFPAEGFNIY